MSNIQFFFYSLRVLLQKSTVEAEQADSESTEGSRGLVRSVIEESLKKLEEEKEIPVRPIRWELGSSWIQHLQKKETETDKKSSKTSGDDNSGEPAVKGLGMKFKSLKKREKKSESESNTLEKEDLDASSELDIGELNGAELSFEPELKKIVSEDAFSRLKDSRTGLHLKVSELTEINRSLFLIFYCH